MMAESHAALITLNQKQPNVSGDEVARVVLRDPMLLLRVMKMVNSRRKGSLSQPVLTVEHAVMMMGLSAFFARVLEAPVAEQVLEAPPLAGLYRVAMRGMHAGGQARDWAMLRLDLNVEEVVIAAMLQELSAQLLWVAVPEAMQDYVKQMARTTRADAEQAIFGASLDAITLELMTRWNLPPLSVSAQRSEECALHVRPRLVAIARDLARSVERGWHGEETLQLLGAAAEGLHESLDDLVARVHRTSAKGARAVMIPGAEPAARWMPLLPGPWPEDADPVDIATAPSTPSPEVGGQATTSGDVYEDVMQRISAHLDGSLHLNGLMQLAFKGLRDGIGLKRVTFALASQDKSRLQGRFSVGVAEGSPLKHFSFDLLPNNLFGRLMEKQQAFWMNDELRGKVGSLVTPTIAQATSGSSFFAMSIAVRGQMVGLFYADDEGHALSAERYEKFKKLCTQAAVGMAHLAKS